MSSLMQYIFDYRHPRIVRHIELQSIKSNTQKKKKMYVSFNEFSSFAVNWIIFKNYIKIEEFMNIKLF